LLCKGNSFTIMKKILIYLVILLASFGQAKASGCSIYGGASLCPGSNNILYTANKDLSGGDWGFVNLVWTISGSGHFIDNGNGGVISNGGHTFTVLPDPATGDFTPPLIAANITWDNVNNTTASIQAVYTYFLGLTLTGTLNVGIGIIGSPTSIQNAPIAICTSSTPESFTLSCPNSLTGTDASSYVWSASHATISGAGSSATLIKIVGDNNPIVVSVRFHNAFCGISSVGAATITIPRCTGVPTSGAVLISQTSPVKSVTEFQFAPGTGGTFVEISSDGVTYSNSFYVSVPAGTTENVWVRSANDCGPGLAREFVCKAPPCPSCPKSMVHTGGVPTILKEVSLFPNPASDYLTLEIPALEQPVTVSVFNLNGQLVRKEIVEGGSTSHMDIQSLSVGMYAVHIVSADGSAIRIVQKLQIVR